MELAGRVASEMSVGGVIFYGIMFVIGLLLVCNIADMADRCSALILTVLPGPVERVSPRSLRFAGGVVAIVAFIGLLVEIRMGLT